MILTDNTGHLKYIKLKVLKFLNFTESEGMSDDKLVMSEEQ